MNTTSAIQDFRRARRRASMEQIIARLTGKSADLLSYDEVRKKLRAVEQSPEELRNIPLDAIVGSVGRYSDFTRSFLPRLDSDEDRWARVQIAVSEPTGVPPIEVYQIGEAYFVRDGNHRVSVARDFGASHIQAYVTVVQTKVPLSPDDQPDDLIIKAEYADFLAHTQMDHICPGADLVLTVPGQYRRLEEHIQVHHYFMGLDEQRNIPYAEAVAHWYEEYYLPIVEVIRNRGVLRGFPGRTETDLYLWVSEHRAILTENFGQDVRTEMAAEDLLSKVRLQARSMLTRIKDAILGAVTSDEVGPSLQSIRRREDLLEGKEEGPLFADILVGVGGGDERWDALNQALIVARREEARLNGLHVLPSQDFREGEDARALQVEFDRRCAEAGVDGTLNISVGEAADCLSERSRFNDLVIVNLAYPPEPTPLARLSSGFRKLIRNCPRPILAVPGVVTPMERGLLAYDGSPKAEDAMFVATYMAVRWQISFTVVVVDESKIDSSMTMGRAREYLGRHGAHANFVKEDGPVADAILRTAARSSSDLIVMGGYGAAPVVEVVLGSAVDQVLRESRTPMLICR